MSLTAQPDERTDTLQVYLGHGGAGTLARAVGPASAVGGSRGGAALQRVTSSVLRGGLTGWVHVGMLVRKLRGRADPLAGLGQRETFLALGRLVQAAVEARPLPEGPPVGATHTAHVQVFSTPVGAQEAVERIQRVLRPYTAAGTVTRTGPAVIAWFAIRHLIATHSRAYSLQVVHVGVDGVPGGRLSLMLPHAPDESVTRVGCSGDGSRRVRRRRARPRASGAPGPVVVDVSGLQAYLDAYREHLTRELLLEPVMSAGAVRELAWVPEPTPDAGVAVAGTVPGAVRAEVVLRMAEQALAQLGERSPRSAGVRLGGPEPDGDLLVQRWAVGSGGEYVLSVAARSGDRRRPTQVLIHVAAADRFADEPDDAHAAGGLPALPPPPHEPPRTGPAVDEARSLTLIPLWWRSADARCDGNDVILYEMPFRGQRLRVRANDYPAEPMYTLLVGEPGAEVAALDLEHWPSSWAWLPSF